ncbi:hypothetical protein HanRHA438_Chr12g0538261 [Helianthus annuus]|nr:hypothetical protein HanRHA438_Chr12g0538261 [Helianthus annuus]
MGGHALLCDDGDVIQIGWCSIIIGWTKCMDVVVHSRILTFTRLWFIRVLEPILLNAFSNLSG